MNQCPAKRRTEVSSGESVRIVRELQGFSQNELSQLSGIAQATLSAIENDRVRVGCRTRQGSGRRTTLPSRRSGCPRVGVAR
jgi:DNA-binding XRE family transcriptional regulator